MLRNIPSCIPPELLKVMAEMGHGDTLVIGDANFAAKSIAESSGHINIRCDGNGAVEMLDAILELFPLDAFSLKPVTIMDKEDKNLETPVWEEFKKIVKKHDSRGDDSIRFIDRFEFYKEAKNAYAVVSTTERAFYACIMIQKGCL